MMQKQYRNLNIKLILKQKPKHLIWVAETYPILEAARSSYRIVHRNFFDISFTGLFSTNIQLACFIFISQLEVYVTQYHGRNGQMSYRTQRKRQDKVCAIPLVAINLLSIAVAFPVTVSTLTYNSSPAIHFTASSPGNIMDEEDRCPIELTESARTSLRATSLVAKPVAVASAAAVVEGHASVLRLAERPGRLLVRAVACFLRHRALSCSVQRQLVPRSSCTVHGF